jgi:hypothetical protein
LRVEVEGIPFVSGSRFAFALGSLTIDVQNAWGREGLVVYSSELVGGC